MITKWRYGFLSCMGLALTLAISGCGRNSTNRNLVTSGSAQPDLISLQSLHTASTTIGAGSDTLIVNVSEDYYKGNAKFTVSMDGAQQGGTLTATARRKYGQTQQFIFHGNWGSGDHTVTVTFLNDLWSGTPRTDRNLYVNSITYDDVASFPISAALMGNGGVDFSVSGPSPQSCAQSANDTVVTTVGDSICDSSGNIWTLVASNSGQITLNGNILSETNHVTELAYVDGNFWQLGSGLWWEALLVSNGVVTWSSGTSTSPLSPAPAPAPAPAPVSTLLGVSNGFPGQSTDLTNLASFMNAMGQAPDIILIYADYTHSVNVWATDQDWTISQTQISPYEKAAIPMIGLPMNSTVDGLSSSQFFQNIINGNYDSVYNGILSRWSNAGYKTLYVRPGWEFNGGWYPWAVNSSNLAAFKSAFAHMATLAHNFSGSKVLVDWNPAAGWQGQYALEASSEYPGDQYVDVITIDTYGVDEGGTDDSQVLDTTGYSAVTAAQMAVAHNKPLGFDEVGAGSNDAQFPANLAQAIHNVPGVRVDHFCIWDRADGGNSNLVWSDTPTSATAWKQAYDTIKALSQ